MARFLDVIDVPTPLDSAFEYLAQFQHSAEWDPGIVEARRLDDGPLAVGSRFEIIVSFLGRRIRMEYTLVAHEPPHRIVLRGTGGAVVSVDEITFTPRPDGTRITYDARLELSGLARLANPLLDLVFQRLGAAASRGLRERMTAMAPKAGRTGTRLRGARSAGAGR